MKKLFTYASILSVLLLSACHDDEKGTDPRTKNMNLLTSSVWVTESVDHTTDGDLTFQYENFSIAFTQTGSSGMDGEYIAVNGGNAFPDSYGEWSLSSDSKTILLSNDQEMTIESLTEGSLVLNFIVEPPTGGRVEGVSGEFTFHLKH